MAEVIARLALIGCVHSGSKFADINDFEKYVKLTEDKKIPTKLGILGDLFENAIPVRGKGMMFEQNLTPDEQIDDIARVLHPHREDILFACTSNHSRRTYQEVGIDMDSQLYKRLGVPSIYQGLQGVVMFHGKKIAFAHGNGSGDNWTDSKKLYAIYPDADIVATSHRHEMTSKWHGNFKIDGRGRRAKKYVLFVRTGGLMDWADYAKAELYTPQKPGFSILYFMSDGKVRVDTNGL